MSARALTVALAALVLLATPASAAAFYGNGAAGGGGAEIVSADFGRLEQGDDATQYAAISAGGRYVAMQTAARNFFADDDPDPAGFYRAGGIFRFDLETRALQKVADGSLFEEETNIFRRRGAAGPSISADGRYVAFSTGENLVAADVNGSVDVYVRDMAVPIGELGAFDLVSARDGGDTPASYGGPSSFPGNNPGAEASRGVAISADGQRVAFVTTAPSDLPAAPAADVPAGQIFVRDRAADTTTLVTAVRDSGTGQMTTQPAGGAAGAAISGDGTAVAWNGKNAATQTRFLGGENEDASFDYYLWRRLADGPTAPTRRITGAADPDDPGCPPSSVTFFDQFSTGPCFGPLAEQESLRAGISGQLPALSGDGYTVAFLTGSGPRLPVAGGAALDLYVTQMTPGASRKGATIELTRDSTGDATTSPTLTSVALSADGRYAALVTARTRFTLPALELRGPQRSVPGKGELYVADLRERTIERVARSTAGGDIDGDVIGGATISGDGGRVAFASFAGNLFFGDANNRSDAFVATRQPDPDGGSGDDGRRDTGPAGTIEVDREGPRIGVQAKSRPDGGVLLTVSVPTAGGVKAVAKGAAGTPRKLRTLATATGRARGAARSSVRVLLEPVERYLGELKTLGTLRARAFVSFVASQGGRRASASIKVVFKDGIQSNPRRRDPSG